MPLDNLHMTTLEVTHSRSPQEIDHLVSVLLPNIDNILELPRTRRARLVKPMVSYDSAALALSFVPASGEVTREAAQPPDDAYTYHHLRRDLHGAVEKAGVKVASRYVVPSSHITIARFNTPNVFGNCEAVMDHELTTDIARRETWIDAIEEINKRLEEEYWPKPDEDMPAGGEWIIAEERGLDFRKGRLWYGGGETVKLGKSVILRG